MSKALYRKYRPKALSDVVGEAQVTDVLEKSLKSGKISHAYLFVGPRGCGKTSVARIFAHEVNNFKYELEDDYVDIIEIDAASNTGVDNIRELREKAMIAPSRGKYKVYIIDEVHMLSKSAFNALLKTLEEPPAHVIFIMATTDAYKVPVTITSRSQTYTFKLADETTMCGFLKSVCEKEGIKISDEAIGVVAKRGGGSFRDSLSLLDQISTLSEGEITKELVVSALGLPEDEKIEKIIKDRSIEVLKDLLSSGVKAETIAEEMIGRIISKPEFGLDLLPKLVEVRAPFAEAKLLVALCGDDAFVGGRLRQPVVTGGASLHSLPVGREHRLVNTSSPSQHTVRNDTIISTNSEHRLVNTPSPSQSATTEFSWEEFLERVRGLNDAIHSQLLKTTHRFTDNILDIFPDKKITKTILSRDNNKRILVEAGGGVKITIHEVGELSVELPENSKLSQISDIMGKVEEVKNNGGKIPF